MKRLYVDTNIFIRLFEGNDALTYALAELFLFERPGDEPFLATSELTLAEALVTPYRNSDERLIDGYDSWITSNPYLEVGPIHRQILWDAAVLRSQNPSLKLPDAIHVSTAIDMNCSHFLSADERLSNRYELVHTRHGMTRVAGGVEVLRPSVELVRDLVAGARDQS